MQITSLSTSAMDTAWENDVTLWVGVWPCLMHDGTAALAAQGKPEPNARKCLTRDGGHVRAPLADPGVSQHDGHGRPLDREQGHRGEGVEGMSA